MDCIFCKIINREIPSNIIYEDDKIIAFHDVNPMAPVHGLVIPKKHISSLSEITCEDSDLIGHLVSMMPEIADKLNVKDSGYRVVVNSGKDGGQTVFHLHFHILGGKELNMAFA